MTPACRSTLHSSASPVAPKRVAHTLLPPQPHAIHLCALASLADPPYSSASLRDFSPNTCCPPTLPPFPLQLPPSLPSSISLSCLCLRYSPPRLAVCLFL
ncbi:hypothetical protein CLOM_g16827 [Closterium sp. NIES-68]|nr:hypothetical protein CLOM_g16824 [Closterium sp. NIES-68]GJP32233.1 hypothetical protein CLOM_g16827 [Closterium sp. NIES-68]GJP75622.1 hypothetical protein CLOP_g6050 [Closterium sp. NIES-67]GJP75625.1 hypothetical protein CLOP_g6053 [Closterium sp. NIES-67]